MSVPHQLADVPPQLFYKIEDAEALMFPDGQTFVDSPTMYMAWQAAMIASRRIARTWNSSQTLKARVDHGRWIVNCQGCGDGVYTHPAWQIACCGNCGAMYRGIEFPEQLAEITRLLLMRPNRENQNWFPHEPVWKLKLENFAHRLAA